MEFIMIDAALFDSLLEKLNKLVDEANKIRNRGKDAILEQWLDGQEICEILSVRRRTLQEWEVQRTDFVFSSRW